MNSLIYDTHEFSEYHCSPDIHSAQQKDLTSKDSADIGATSKCYGSDSPVIHMIVYPVLKRNELVVIAPIASPDIGSKITTGMQLQITGDDPSQNLTVEVIAAGNRSQTSTCPWAFPSYEKIQTAWVVPDPERVTGGVLYIALPFGYNPKSINISFPASANVAEFSNVATQYTFVPGQDDTFTINGIPTTCPLSFGSTAAAATVSCDDAGCSSDSK